MENYFGRKSRPQVTNRSSRWSLRQRAISLGLNMYVSSRTSEAQNQDPYAVSQMRWNAFVDLKPTTAAINNQLSDYGSRAQATPFFERPWLRLSGTPRIFNLNSSRPS